MLKRLCSSLFLAVVLSISTVAAQARAPLSSAEHLQKLTRSEFVNFHMSLLEVAALRERSSRLPTKLIPEGALHTSTSYQMLIEFLLQSAHAESREGKCLFGGWASFKVNGVCKTPWSFAGDQELKEIGPTYDSEFYCGGSNKFRCNPILFGPGSGDGKGHCIEIDGYDDLTLNCFKKAKETPEEIFDLYRNNPTFRFAYLNLVEETMNFCADAEGYDACRYLMASAQSTKNFVCNDQDLNKLLGSERFMELESLWGNLEGELIQNKGRAAALGERVINHVERYPLPEPRQTELPQVEGTDFDNYSNSPQVHKMIEGLKKGLSLTCGQPNLRRSSDPYNNCSARRPNKVNAPLYKCWRYVKLGLMEADLADNYIASEFAVHAGSHLEREGFTNLLDNPEYTDMTPATAPPGAVLVYSKQGSYTPGHIEVKTHNGTYISDFESDSPITDYNPRRRLIGIYINPDIGKN